MKRLKITGLITSITLILVLVLGAGCALLPRVETSPPPSPTATRNATPIDSEWSPATTDSQAPMLPSIADVVAKVKPSVVAISTEVTFDLFNQPFTREGGGSGWIISEDGIIVTNSHVVAEADNITVTLDDGRTFTVDMDTVANDELTDLAVLKIDAENLPAATVGDSDKLRIGDWVVAIGNSLGRGTRATQGIVSRKDVWIQAEQGRILYGLIETDAAINPGNSGGPLVNMAGEVIGITSVKAAQVEVEGVGWAISTKVAMPDIQQLISIGRVIHPWLGVGLYTVDEYAIRRYGLAVDSGVLITQLVPGSPADKAGLQVGDVIVGIDSKETSTVEELIIAIRSSQVGQNIEITFWRGKTKETTRAVLAERPPPT